MARDRDDDDRDDRRRDDDDDRPRRRRDDDDDYDRPPRKSGSGMKIVLIVLGIVGVVVVALGAGLFFAVQKVREAAARMQSSNNLKQLSIGMQSYTDVNGKLSGPFVDPPPGVSPLPPADRLSWRVEILPYIEQDNVYRSIQRGQAWNSPANQPFTSQPIKTFTDPNDMADANTRFRCFYDNGALFSTNPKDRIATNAIPDGASNTIMFAESGERVPWAQFNEWAFDPAAPPPPLGHPTRDTFMVGMADGSVRVVKKTVSPAALNAAITRAGNDAPGPDFK